MELKGFAEKLHTIKLFNALNYAEQKFGEDSEQYKVIENLRCEVQAREPLILQPVPLDKYLGQGILDILGEDGFIQIMGAADFVELYYSAE